MRAEEDTGNPDRWINAAHVVDDPWIVAAARSGDARAMRCLAHRIMVAPSAAFQRRASADGAGPAAGTARPDWVPPALVIHEAQVLESARWFAAAAWYGDDQARAELDDYLRYEHSGQHFARVPAETRWRRARTPMQCRTGAEQGYASCMLRWAAQLHALGPGHDADAVHWLERAQHGQPDVPEPAGILAMPATVPVTIVVTALVTTAVIPFVQAMLTKAAEDSYSALRRWLLDVFCRALPPQHEPHHDDQLLVISPPQDQHGAVLQLWTDLPDEAISTLTQLLYDMRAGQPQSPATEQRWHWNGAAHRWELLHSPDPGHKPPESDGR